MHPNFDTRKLIGGIVAENAEHGHREYQKDEVIDPSPNENVHKMIEKMLTQSDDRIDLERDGTIDQFIRFVLNHLHPLGNLSMASEKTLSASLQPCFHLRPTRGKFNEVKEVARVEHCFGNHLEKLDNECRDGTKVVLNVYP